MLSQAYKYQFIFDYNALEITTCPILYRKATSISIITKLSDRDGPGNVKFVSYLDNRKNETLNYTANIPYDDGRLISISSIVSVPVPTKTGRHTLYMYVIDATNEVSNIISTTFLFENVFESHLKENHFKRNTRQLLLFSRIVDIE